MLRASFSAVVSLLCVVLLSTGCGGGGSSAASATNPTVRDLNRIGFAVHGYFDARKQGPSKPEDLAPFLVQGDELRAYDLLKSGRIVLVWDLSPTGIKVGERVLGYAAETPKQGGLVLMTSIEVRTMTAAEFAAAPKAN